MRSGREKKAPNKKYRKEINRDIYNITGEEKVYYENWTDETIEIIYNVINAIQVNEEQGGELYKVYENGRMFRIR